MLDRRQFFGSVAVPAAAAGVFAVTLNASRALAAAADLASHPGAPADIASDEEFWFEVQRAFTADRSMSNLNNGGVSPAPAAVQQAMQRYLEYSNTAPAYTMWRVLEPQRETVRSRLAAFAGCSPEEVAITRNTSESLQTVQFGLGLRRGDEVLAADQEYPRMVTTFRQRERRDGIVLRQFALPPPPWDTARTVALYEGQLTPKTKVLLVSHMVFLNGQVLPVKALVAMARRHGVLTIVDGAHSFAHLAFTLADLDCDFYGTSLHKWLAAPHGTGMLYVRKERIRDVWPLMAAPDTLDGDIRKFEEIGTHPAANALAIGEALVFHQGIGSARKEARLRYLRDRWARRVASRERVRLHTSLDPAQSCALATVQLEGIDSGKLADHLWDRHRILVAAIKHPQFEGIRVAPSVYTTVEEVDRFAEILEQIAQKGLPA